MTANRTSKAADSTETEVEASVPQQSAGSEKVTVIGKTEDGKRVIVVEDEDTEKTTAVEKFKNLLRNKKVLAGLGGVAALVVIALIRNSESGSDVEGESGEPSDENTTD